MAVEGPDELIADVDPDRIRQALENLLHNARTHAPGSPIVVTLRREERDSGAWAVMEVHDQGPGIAPTVLGQFMARFVCGQYSKGLGLGLYLAHNIMKTHGGMLTVESTLGHGTTFQFAMPTATSYGAQRWVRRHSPARRRRVPRPAQTAFGDSPLPEITRTAGARAPRRTAR